MKKKKKKKGLNGEKEVIGTMGKLVTKRMLLQGIRLRGLGAG
jgi:hypothetical protein